MMKVLAALAAIAMLSHAVAADEYVWQEDKPSGNFTFSKVDMKLQGGGSDWKPRAIAQVVMQGRTEKKITAGTLKYQGKSSIFGLFFATVRCSSAVKSSFFLTL